MSNEYKAKLSLRPATNNLVCTLESILNQMSSHDGSISRCEINSNGWLVFYHNDKESSNQSRSEICVNEEKIVVQFPPSSSVTCITRALRDIVNQLNRKQISFGREIPIKSVKVENNFLKICLAESTPIYDQLPGHSKVREQKEDQPEKGLLLLIDGSNLLSRGYFATSYGQDESTLMKTSTGVYTNAIKVLIEKLLHLIQCYKPTHLAFCWDVRRNETFRRNIFSEYKGNRSSTPDPLVQQFETAKGLLDEMGVKQFTVSPYEADDLLGTFAKRWSEEKRGECLIYSNDRDLYQILDENISQIVVKGKEELVYTMDSFLEEYGLRHPLQWIDVKSLLGDKGDNILGVPGVGEAAAIPLIKKYGSIEELYENLPALDTSFKRYIKKLEAGRESAFLSKKLATIVSCVEEINRISFEDLRLQLNREGMKSGFNRLELNSLLKREELWS